MIQAWKDLRFSAKLTLIFFLVLSLTIGVITIRDTALTPPKTGLRL